MDTLWFHASWAIGAYLLGSVPAGDLVARAAGVNIRARGTGNPGAANVFREVGARWGVAVLLVDVAKGAVAILPLTLLGAAPWARAVSAGAVLAGHMFPAFWRFRGGTGMAVGMGASLGLLPVGGLAAAPLTIAVVALSRNAGYSGALFVAVTGVVGGVVHRDAASVLAIVLIGVALAVRARLQYRHRPSPGG